MSEYDPAELPAPTPRSRLRIWILLTLLLGACGGSGWLAWRYVRAGDSAGWLKTAEEARLAGRLNEAVLQYKNVLQIDPQQTLARWRLGQIYLELKQAAPAIAELERARPLLATHPELALDLARARLGNGEPKKALAALNTWTGERTAEVLALDAQTQQALGDTTRAKEMLAKATQQHPQAPSLLLATARLALSQGDLAGAAGSLNAALQAAPTDPEALFLSGQTALMQNNFPAAEVAFRSNLNRAARKEEGYAGLIQSLVAQNKLKEARLVLDELVKVSPKSSGTRFVQGALAYAEGNWGAAETALLDILNLMPTNPRALLMLADAELRQKKFNQAGAHLKTFRTSYPEQLAGARLYANLMLAQGRPQEAAAALRPLIGETSKDPELLALLSYAQFAAGDVKNGATTLARAQILAPDAPSLKAQKAWGEVLAGDTVGGLSDLEGLVAAAPDNASPRQLLAYLQVLTGHSEAAVETAQALVKLRPKDALAFNLLGIAQGQAKRPDDAARSFAQAIAIDPNFAPALTNAGVLALERKDVKQGRAQLEAALAHDPAYTSASLALALLAEREGRAADARRLVETAASAQPRAAQPRWMLALRSLREGDTATALRYGQEAFEIAPTTLQSRLLWAQILLDARAPEKARELLVALHQEDPTLAPAALLLAAAYRESGNLEAARETYQALLKIQPDDLQTLWGLFQLEAGSKHLDAARVVVARLQKAHPARALGDLASGQLAAANGDHAAAVQAFAVAFDKQPSTAILIQLVSALHAAGDLSGAQQRLTHWLSTHPDDVAVRGNLGGLALEGGQFALAQTQFEALLKTAPDNPIALNNLAWLYQRAGDPRALGLAERAQTALPDSAEAADTLGWILVQARQLQRGLKLLERAHRNASAQPSIAYHYAYALVEAGDLAPAREILQRFLATPDKFDEREKAELLQQKVGAG